MSPRANIVPGPRTLVPLEGSFTLRPETLICPDPASLARAEQLAGMLAPALGWWPRVSRSSAAEDCITLLIDPSLAGLGTEGYRLSVSSRRIELVAADPAGLFYAIQTLRQLLPPEVFSPAPVPGISWIVPGVQIEDAPRFEWRGLMLDCCRHFMPPDFVRRFIDLLALHKMNRFHWHLTEDQGWRIQIRKYPRLTEVGAWRKQTLVGHGRDKPERYDGIPHGGFYTQEQIGHIVRYAAERNVTIVPEIEMPGHSVAAIASYPELGNSPEKPLEVWTRWGINPNILNVEESTVRFYQDVLEELVELFPSRFIHVGGDEAPKEQWVNSPRAQARKRELGLKDEHELQSWFIRRMDEFLTTRGRRLIGWDEILEGGLAPGAAVMSWRGEEGGIAAAKAGHDVVLAPHTSTYLDYCQAPDPATEPLSIGGFLPLDKVYAYEPIPAALTEDEVRHVLGAQGQLWTEYVPSPGHAEYMLYPRACALAEVAWSPKAQRDYRGFLPRLQQHLDRLRLLGVNYHPIS